jgi:methionyl-tRNA formyltransferase
MAMRRVAARIAADLPGLWAQALPQGAGGRPWPRDSEEERRLDLKGGVDDARRLLRAFGLLQCTAGVGARTLYVDKAVAWHETHAHAPGSLVHGNGRSMVFALKDGYLAILKWALTPPNQWDPAED